MPSHRDFLHAGLQIVLYAFFYAAAAVFLGTALRLILPEEGYLVMVVVTGLAASLTANWVAMRIYEQRPLLDIGLRWNSGTACNLACGLAGGIGSAALVLSIPLVLRVAQIHTLPGAAVHPRTLFFLGIMLLAGSAGEEILFRGFGFQVLLKVLGPAATILPVGVLFAALHANNPNASTLGLMNTAGFGVLFGYAFFRSRDIWLPIGLHFGWNLTLPLFGVNVSGLKIEMTGYVMEWSAGPLWSGGAYGPEASLLTSSVLLVLFVYLWKAPVRQQLSPLLDRSAETPPCDPGTQPSSPLR